MMPNKWRTLTLPSLREIKPIEAGEHVVDGLLASWPFRTCRRSPDEMSWSPHVEMYATPRDSSGMMLMMPWCGTAIG